MRKFGLLLAALLLNVTCEAADAYRVSGWLSTEAESAHISIGRIRNVHPAWNIDTGLRGLLGPYGYVVGGLWTETDLSNHNRDRHKVFFHELDPLIAYGYRWDFAEDWYFNTMAGLQWNYMSGYYGDSKRSYDEWQIKEELKTPWITPWFAMRNFYWPVAKSSFRVGVKRSFKITDRLSFDPNVWFDGGCRKWNRQRFGYKTCDIDAIGQGVNSMTVRLFMGYQLLDELKLYGGLAEYIVLDSEVRSQLRANPDETSRRELLVATVGVSYEF